VPCRTSPNRRRNSAVSNPHFALATAARNGPYMLRPEGRRATEPSPQNLPGYVLGLQSLAASTGTPPESGRECSLDKDSNMKTEKPDAPPKGATIIFFPRDRIVRAILPGNRVYDPPGPRYPEWDEERRAPSHSSPQPREPTAVRHRGFSLSHSVSCRGHRIEGTPCTYQAAGEGIGSARAAGTLVRIPLHRKEKEYRA
jgi:hypothetical protein